MRSLAPAAPSHATHQTPRTNTLITTLPPKLLDWRAVESVDYKQYVANLRAAGCPEKTLRDVIIADINELYRNRFRELFPPANRVQYWKTSSPMADLFDETRINKGNELRKEKRELVKTLLSSELSDEEDRSAIQLDNYSDRLFEFLSPEKHTAMKELEDQFAVKMLGTYKSTWRGDEGPADAVRAEKDEAILKVLTREEKFEYDLRKSDTATFLRVGLGGFEVTEQEFRALFPEIKSFIEQAGKPGFGAMIRGQPDPRPEGGSARLELKTKLQAALGADRFEQLLQQTGWNLSAEAQE